MNEFERKHAEWEERQIERAAEGKAKCGVIEVCERCGELIYEGDVYYEIAGCAYCDKCIENAKTVA